jgi:hypothetical protein
MYNEPKTRSMKAIMCAVIVALQFGLSAQESEHLSGSAIESMETNEIQAARSIVEHAMSEVKVYPNPSEGNIFIQGKVGSNCTIYTMAGTYIGTWVIGLEGTVAIQDLGVGMYVATVQEENSRIQHKFIVL